MEEKEILNSFSISLRMGKIEAGPPLSTILGNYGLNTVKVCKELNEYTKELPIFFLLEVKVIIYIDKSYKFIVFEPSTSSLLRLVSLKKEILIKASGGKKIKNVDSVYLKDIYLISLFKFGNCFDSSLKSVYGTLSSLNLYVIK
jgi:large subunit ribosomal protein L11